MQQQKSNGNSSNFKGQTFILANDFCFVQKTIERLRKKQGIPERV